MPVTLDLEQKVALREKLLQREDWFPKTFRVGTICTMYNQHKKHAHWHFISSVPKLMSSAAYQNWESPGALQLL